MCRRMACYGVGKLQDRGARGGEVARALVLGLRVRARVSACVFVCVRCWFITPDTLDLIPCFSTCATRSRKKFTRSCVYAVCTPPNLKPNKISKSH